MSAPDFPRAHKAFAAMEISAADGVTQCIGDGERRIDGAAPLDRAGPDELAFSTSATASAIDASRAGTVICTAQAASGVTRRDVTLLVSETPRLTFARVLSRYFVAARRVGIHATAWVHGSARVAPDAYVGPFAVIDADCVVGSACDLHAHVCLYPGTRVGDRVILHAGVVIGADGFGHVRNAVGQLEKFPQLGGVCIGDDVEIGANSCVARGTLSDTVVASGVRMDNMVHVAHNVRVEPDVVLTAQVTIAGSTTIGARAWLAPGATIMDGISIGEDAVIGLGAVVIASVPSGVTVAGNPARALQRTAPVSP